MLRGERLAMPADDYPVGSVATTFRIVEALNELGTAGVTELSDAIGVSDSSVHKHLT